MSSAYEPSSRNATIVVPVVVVAGIAGLAVGWFIAPSGAPALDYLHAVASPTCFGALCIYAVRQGGRAARLMPLLLLAMFLLSIARSADIPALSALGLVAAAIVGVTTLRGQQRATIASTVVCCALLAATLVGGRLVH